MDTIPMTHSDNVSLARQGVDSLQAIKTTVKDQNLF